MLPTLALILSSCVGSNPHDVEVEVAMSLAVALQEKKVQEPPKLVVPPPKQIQLKPQPVQVVPIYKPVIPQYQFTPQYYFYPRTTYYRGFQSYSCPGGT